MNYSSQESLKKVVEEGDLEYLRSAAACEPNECLERLVSSSGYKYNIFHFIIAADNNNVEFMDEAMKIVPVPIVQSLLCQGEEEYQFNPLHVAAKKGKHKMVKLILEYYRSLASTSTDDSNKPWLGINKFGETPLHLALCYRYERIAFEILSMDVELLSSMVDSIGNSPLFIAALRGFNRTVLQILMSAPNCSFSGERGFTAVHYAASCSETFLRQVLEAYPEFLSEGDDDGLGVIYSWMEIGQLLPFEYILQSQWKNNFTREWRRFSYIKGRSPLHVAAVSTFEEDMVEIVKLLYDVPDIKDIFKELCYERDNNNNTPVELAISQGNEKLALLFLSMDEKLDRAQPDLLFKAIECGCHNVAKFLLEWTAQNDGDKFLKSSERNVFHIVWQSTEKMGKLIVEHRPELINVEDCNGKKPLEIASEKGATWLVKLNLQTDRQSIVKAPLAWVEACRNGYLSTVLAFIDESPYFRNIYRQHQETPLHHLQKVSYRELQELLKNNLMKEMKNIRNRQGETPLHAAIRNENIDSAEVLLTNDRVDWSIKDNNNKTAKDLLREKCKTDVIWADMCKMIGRDPTLKMTYIHDKIDLARMQETVSLVAAMLATITFTAAFTLPGGHDSDSGEAILTRKAAFLTFLMSDTYAMCCSMLILFCVIWSLVCDRNRSSSLIDRSLQLLKQSLYGTLVAFMAGAYVVIHQKSMWAAIAVIIMCSLVIVLAQRNVLYGALDYLKFSQHESPEAGERKLSHWRKQASNINRFSKGKHSKYAPHPTVATHQNEENERASPDGEHESEIKGKYVKNAPQTATVTHQNDENQRATLDSPDENEINEEASLSSNIHSQIDSIV